MPKIALNNNELDRWVASIDLDPVKCDELTQEMIWSDNKAHLWQAKRFSGSPSFYPVYRWRDYYSYSPLVLLLKKGTFELDEQVANRILTEGRNYTSSNGTLDREIKRVGGPKVPRFQIRTPEEYAKAISEALKKDIARMEALHPGKTNVIMCGGKDSLNLLLLPWKNPVVVASAAPNYELVKRFLADNDLSYRLIELTDNDTSTLEKEILINFCRNNLEHCRWGGALTRITNDFGGNLIFWKGQLGSTLMNITWPVYVDPPGKDWDGVKRLCALWGGRGEYWLRNAFKNTGITQFRTFRTRWVRGAMWQAVHLSFLRQLTGALFISAYHGPEMQRVIDRVDMNRAVPYDIRPMIGELLYGRPVRYPSDNPSPQSSQIRKGISDLATFMNVLRSVGIQVK